MSIIDFIPSLIVQFTQIFLGWISCLWKIMIYIYPLEKSISRYLMLFNIYCGDGSRWLYFARFSVSFVCFVHYFNYSMNQRLGRFGFFCLFVSYVCVNDLKNLKQINFKKPNWIGTSSTVIIAFHYPSVL